MGMERHNAQLFVVTARTAALFLDGPGRLGLIIRTGGARRCNRTVGIVGGNVGHETPSHWVACALRKPGGARPQTGGGGPRHVMMAIKPDY